MINYLWAIMILIGIVYGFFSGNMNAVTSAIIDESKSAVSLCVTLLGVMAMWTGVMKIAEKAGILSWITKKISPLLTFLFPGVPKNHEARKYIATNMIANFFGLGWAATPPGLKAMKALQTLNKNREVATKEMCTFLIINISSVQLISMNIIAYRSQYGSANPTETVGPSIIATIINTLAGVAFCKIMMKVAEK